LRKVSEIRSEVRSQIAQVKALGIDLSNLTSDL
jgi:hypothetical protein